MKVGDKVVMIGCHYTDGSSCRLQVGKTATIRQLGYFDDVDKECDYFVHVVDQAGFSWHLSAKEVKLITQQLLFSFMSDNAKTSVSVKKKVKGAKTCVM